MQQLRPAQASAACGGSQARRCVSAAAHLPAPSALLATAAACRRPFQAACTVPPCAASSSSSRSSCNSLPFSPLPQRRTVACSSSAAAAGQPADNTGSSDSSSGGGSGWYKAAIGFAILAAAGVAAANNDAATAYAESLLSGPLGKSGFFAAFSLIFLSEIGDKTFFIAALLAMKFGRWLSWLGSVAALVVMTGISVGIGAVFAAVPEALKTSIPVGELAGGFHLRFEQHGMLHILYAASCVHCAAGSDYASLSCSLAFSSVEVLRAAVNCDADGAHSRYVRIHMPYII